MEILRDLESSSLSRVGYDRENRVLHVWYVGNDTEYEYEQVSAKEWRELKQAESRGRFVNFRIKPYHAMSHPAPFDREK